MRHSASERLEVLWTPLIDGVAIEIRDEGVFRRQAYPAQAEGGFGIQVMLGLMDELTICGGREDSPGTLVRLVKRAHEPCLVSYPA
jgi:two-component sensor histidine kinase